MMANENDSLQTDVMTTLTEDSEFLALAREGVATVVAGEVAEVTIEREEEVAGCTQVLRFQITRDPYVSPTPPA